MAKEYPKLVKTLDYDVDAARELAEAMNERFGLMARVNELNDLISENKELQKFVWTTQDGKSAAHADLSTDHVANIMNWCVDHEQKITESIKSEARRRKLPIPRQDPIAGGRLSSQASHLLNAYALTSYMRDRTK